MSSAGLNRKAVWLALIASLAFNAGVGTTFGVRTYRKYRSPCPQRDHQPCRDGPCRFGSLGMLDLTPEQHAQMKAARGKMMESGCEVRHEVREQIEVLTELMAASDPDREAIAAQVSKIARLREQLDRRMVEHFLDAKHMLDPDQQGAFNELIRRAFSRGGPGRAGHGGPCGHGKGPGRGRRGSFHDGND